MPELNSKLTSDISWERLPDETPKAYDAFCSYRDLGPQRTLLAAYRCKTGAKQVQRSSGQWQNWYDKFRWRERAIDYDALPALDARRLREAYRSKTGHKQANYVSGQWKDWEEKHPQNTPKTLPSLWADVLSKQAMNRL